MPRRRTGSGRISAVVSSFSPPVSVVMVFASTLEQIRVLNARVLSLWLHPIRTIVPPNVAATTLRHARRLQRWSLALPNLSNQCEDGGLPLLGHFLRFNLPAGSILVEHLARQP